MLRYISLATLPALLSGGAKSPSLQFPPLTDENSIPFVMPWDDSLKGVVSDVSFLNAAPAGKNGPIIAKDGFFLESKTGNRVRFFGTNLGAKACFPSKEDAPKIAAHLAKMGINIVRMHHMNNGWDLDGGTVWKKGKTFLEIDPAQLDKLDFFINELKKRGIYTNINLQTAREYLPEMGFPDEVRKIPSFQKKVDKFNEKMILLQQQYAKDLLDRLNPYTNLKYAADPAIMVVEINNENSLVGWPGESPGAGLEGLPPFFLKDLLGKWNGWLKQKYGSTSGLQKAWAAKDTRTGPSLTGTANKWTWENQSNSAVTFEPYPSTGKEGTSGLKATVTNHAGPDWHIQAHVPGITFTNGKTYTVEFRAKADRNLAINVDSRLAKPDWRNLGLGGTVALTPDWKSHTLTFTANGAEPDSARISFVLGSIRGTVWVEGVTIREGTYAPGLPNGQTVETGTVALPTVGKSVMFTDYTNFLVETEAKYTERMRAYLVGQLGFKNCNIIDSQIAWGGSTALLREKNSPFYDNHEYWNHPTFLGGEWDPKNYRVDRKALVNELPGGLGTLSALSYFRVVDKPYTVSEYNHPAPSDYQCEMMPLYASVGSFQNWDILYTFAWDATGTGEKNDVYSNYFDMSRNPAKKAFFPNTALLFRTGALNTNADAALLRLGRNPWERYMRPDAAWVGVDGAKPDVTKTIVGQTYAPTQFEDDVIKLPEGGKTPFKVYGSEGKRVLVADSEKAAMVSGFVSDQRYPLVGGEISFGKLPTGFASMMLTPADGKPIATSSKQLLTVVSRVENVGMGWNAERTSVSDNWGRGPVRAELVPFALRFKADGPRQVFALDGTGARSKPIQSRFEDGYVTFEVDGRAGSIWYEIVK